MLHPELEKEREENYPTVRAMLTESYGTIDRIGEAVITAVKTGEQGYGFILKLPEETTSVEKELFFKIAKPFSSSKGDEARRQQVFEFMEYVHDDFHEHVKDVIDEVSEDKEISEAEADAKIRSARKAFDSPKVMKDDKGEYTPHLAESVAGRAIPADIQGCEIMMMTKVSGSSIPMTEEGIKKHEEVKKERSWDTGTTRSPSSYSAHNLASMISTVAQMHKKGEKFLKEHSMPMGQNYGIRKYSEVQADIIASLGFDPAQLDGGDLTSKITERKEELKGKVVEGLKSLPTYKESDAEKSPDELLAEAKQAFVDNVKAVAPNMTVEKFDQDLHKTESSGVLSEKQLRLGNQIRQLDQALFLTRDNNLDKIVQMGKEFSSQYQEVERLPQSVVHWDANATNFLLDEATGKMTLIDYDDVAMGPRMVDVMMWNITTPDVFFDGQKIDESIAKSVLQTYDDTLRITGKEARSSSGIMEAWVYGGNKGLAAQLRQFTDLDKLHDTESLDKMFGTLEGTSHCFGVYHKVSYDMTPVLEKSRGETLGALDLEIKPGQLNRVAEESKEVKAAVETYGKAASGHTSKDGVPGLNKESMEEVKEIKGKLQKASWVDRTAKDNPRAGFNVTSSGAREI